MQTETAPLPRNRSLALWDGPCVMCGDHNTGGAELCYECEDYLESQ